MKEPVQYLPLLESVPSEYYRRLENTAKRKNVSVRFAVCEAIEAYVKSGGETSAAVVLQGVRRQVFARIPADYYFDLIGAARRRSIADLPIAVCDMIEAYMKKEGEAPVVSARQAAPAALPAVPAVG